MPLMKTFSRPEISGWKPAPSSISAEMRPSTRTRAAGRLGDAGDQLQRGALARAVAADHAVGRALRHGERHVGQRRKRLARLQIAQDAALQQRALQRRELPAAVAAVDLRDVESSSIAGVITPPPRTSRAAIEQPVAGEKQQHRAGAEREQPLPVADRTLVEEQDLLVRHREVRERVEVEEEMELLHARLEPRVDDRRREEPQRQQVRQDVADVAEVHGQRRQDQRQRRA